MKKASDPSGDKKEGNILRSVLIMIIFGKKKEKIIVY
jgi:hypothetical protein